MSVERPDWVDGAPVEATTPMEVVRDDDGRRVMDDWDGGPTGQGELALADEPEPLLAEAQRLADAQLAEVNAGHETSASFDALPANAQATFRNQEGLDQAFASVDQMRGAMSADAFAAMDADFDALPSDAQQVCAAIISHDWTKYGQAALFEALDKLSDALPLTSSAAFNQFVDEHIIIEGE